MATQPAEITYVPYQQKDEPPRRAALARVEFPLDGYSDEEIQVLGHLSDAVNLMNPIYRDQYEPKTPVIERLVSKLCDVAAGEQKAVLGNYLTILHLQNSPWSLLPRKNHLLQLPEAEVRALITKAGGGSLEADFADVRSFLLDGLSVPDKAGYYPPDMTEDEWQALGEQGQIVNSMFHRENGKVVGRLNEDKYRSTLRPIIEHMTKARDLTGSSAFRLYLDGKIEELRHGTKESRRIADYMWIRHGYKLDVIISTALEVYLDNWKNARGEAAGAVVVENSEAQSLLKALVDRLSSLEANAPWANRKTDIDPSKLPHLRFVDVLTWSGDYVNSPMTIIAQSLPNDDWVINNVGSVNMVYRNTGKAIHALSGDMIASEFLSKSVMDEYGDILFEASQIHSALHELGHTTGAMDPDHRGKEAREYLEAEYSPLEEARAELFGMFAMPRLAREGIITQKMAEAGHYTMLISMVGGLRFVPEQAHVKARNLMWHYLVSHGAIEEVFEEGKRRFRYNLSKVDEVTAELLGTIGNIKASGDKARAAQLREKHCFTDDLRPEIEKRMQPFPLGRGLIFPRLKRDGERYVRTLEYPKSFTDQTLFHSKLLS